MKENAKGSVKHEAEVKQVWGSIVRRGLLGYDAVTTGVQGLAGVEPYPTSVLNEAERRRGGQGQTAKVHSGDLSRAGTGFMTEECWRDWGTGEGWISLYLPPY